LIPASSISKHLTTWGILHNVCILVDINTVLELVPERTLLPQLQLDSVPEQAAKTVVA